MVKRWFVAILMATGIAAQASAIDPALCDDDGVTEVPSWADGRDSNGCLIVEGIPFQYEFFHKHDASGDGTQLSRSAFDGGQTPAEPVSTSSFWLDFDPSGCPALSQGSPTPAHFCTRVIWDTVIDNYLSFAAKADDIWTATGAPYVHTLVKDSSFVNGWKCGNAAANNTGHGTRGPNDDWSCPANTFSEAHSDGIQFGSGTPGKGLPVGGGTVVFQDSHIVNANVSLIHYGGSAQFGANGAVVFQGAELNTKQSIGYADTWQDDCVARGGVEACDRNQVNFGYGADPLWLIDVWGRTRFGITGNPTKIIVVNSGCGETGCAGTVGYFNGWPHPLEGSAAGPGSIPNGAASANCAGSAFTGTCYLYDSVDAAVLDGHAEPLFLRLSDTGWLDGDGDGMPNIKDNCSALVTAEQCDTDGDGYGNACDGDYDQSGSVDFTDAQLYGAALAAGVDTLGIGTDHTCDGIVDFGDTPYSAQQSLGAPGPAGLNCTGQIPCPGT